MAKTLSLALRPRTFKKMFGQSHITGAISKQVEADRWPTAWMFSGQAGSGKTTLARILAVSLQCVHQEQFGSPCNECYTNKDDFSIDEPDTAVNNGVDAIKELIQRSTYAPSKGSNKRVIILDEAQRLTTQAQGALLKHFEDYSPESTVWIKIGRASCRERVYVLV